MNNIPTSSPASGQPAAAPNPAPVEGEWVEPGPPLPRDPARYSRLGLLLVLAGFGGFLLWAALAPLDAGVPAPGTVVVESNRQRIAHLQGGIVKRIHVRNADFVNAGDPLITLDDTQAAAAYQRALEGWYALLAERARLRAERSGASRIQFPDELLKAPAHSGARTQMEAQKQLFQARRSSLEAQLELLDAREKTHAADARAKTKALELLREQLEGMESLAKLGNAPRNDWLRLRRETLDLANQVDIARRQALNSKLEARKAREDFRKEVETSLSAVESKLAQIGEELRSARDRLERMVIQAPVSGHVNALAVHTEGGVIRPGETLMEIIPRDERLLLDVQVPAHLVDRVHPGQLADIQMNTFVHLLQLILEGRVVSVSADLAQSEAAGAPPHYLARVEITPKGLATLGDNRLQPGMPATVVIKTGERSLLEYLLRPLLSRLHTALTET